jgi:hypothetical protein
MKSFKRRIWFFAHSWILYSKHVSYSHHLAPYISHRNAYNILVHSIHSTSVTQSAQAQASNDTLGLSFIKAETPLLSPHPLTLGLKASHSRDDFPEIKFWSKSDWTTAKKDTVASFSRPGERGKTRAAKGENVAMSFIEDINGQPIDGHKATEIRKALRELWVEMDQAGLAPQTWSKVGHTILMNFRQRMYDQFPELTYCDGHWKLDRICMETYSQWANGTNRINNSSHRSNSTKRGSLKPDSLIPPSKKTKLVSKSKKIDDDGQLRSIESGSGAGHEMEVGHHFIYYSLH